jgi:cardiolipin synthase A/B
MNQRPGNVPNGVPAPQACSPPRVPAALPLAPAPRGGQPSRLGAGCRSTLLVGLCLALIGPGLHASSGGRVKTVEHLQSALRQDNLVPRAFIKGDEVRLYFTNAEQRLMFKADWDRTRLRAQGFRYHLAVLKFDASPPALPGPQQKWREPKVLAFGEWQRFARLAVEALAPPEAGHGLHLQRVLGETVLFRDAAGGVKATPFAAVPSGIIIDRRLSQTEAAAAFASDVETNLHAAYPQESAFLLAPPPDGQRSRLALLDLAERRVVVLLAPDVGEDPRGGARVGTRVSDLASFLIVDNAWAILKNPVSSAGRLLNLAVEWPASLFHPRLRTRGSGIPPVTNAPGMDLAAWERWLDTHTGTVRERGSLRLLINGERFFPAFENRLAEATGSIGIHVCIFDCDDVAVRIADLLKQGSTNHVAVRVIFDHTSSRTSGRSLPATPMPAGFVPPKSIARYLTANSRVQVRPFLNPFLTSDHSKVYLIDDRYAYLGGMNLGREYRHEWHDMMVEVEGPVVASIQQEFNQNWAHAGALGDLAFAERALCGKRPGVVVTNRGDFIDLRRIYTKTGRRQIRHAKLESIRRAQHQVFLENPYLYDKSVVVALVKARLRGVDVRVVLPAENDFGSGRRSNLVTANYLLKHGVRVYFYPGMTHVKALLADGWACFGSANFNTLSLRLNQEADLATSDAGFAARFQHELFESDFEKSHELKEPVSVGWSDHLANSLLNQF